jgi:hypothetical protein
LVTFTKGPWQAKGSVTSVGIFALMVQ